MMLCPHSLGVHPQLWMRPSCSLNLANTCYFVYTTMDTLFLGFLFFGFCLWGSPLRILRCYMDNVPLRVPTRSRSVSLTGCTRKVDGYSVCGWSVSLQLTVCICFLVVFNIRSALFAVLTCAVLLVLSTSEDISWFALFIMVFSTDRLCSRWWLELKFRAMTSRPKTPHALQRELLAKTDQRSHWDSRDETNDKAAHRLHRRAVVDETILFYYYLHIFIWYHLRVRSIVS